jgi:hypothetical protein
MFGDPVAQSLQLVLVVLGMLPGLLLLGAPAPVQTTRPLRWLPASLL